MYASSNTADAERSIVLYPQGNIALDIVRENIAEMLIYCGADPMRHIDHAYTALDEEKAFARYVKFISRFHAAELSQAIVLLHKTESISYGILKPRQILTGLIPQLNSALWCVYLDVERDPFVINNLLTVGKIYGLSGKEQVFADYRGNYYLLLRADCNSPEALRKNAMHVRKSTNSFADRETPTARTKRASDPPLSRQDLLGRNNCRTPSESYPAPRRSSRPAPMPKSRRAITETLYRFCSEYPTKPKLGNG